LERDQRARWRTIKMKRSQNSLTVIEMVASIARESFGLGYAALHLSAAIHRAGGNVFLASVDDEKAAYEACEEIGFPRERYIRGATLGPARFRFSPQLLRRLSKIPHNGSSVVHLHGMWTYVSYAAGTLSKRRQCPLVLSPHGSLEPYALEISPRKKSLVSKLYERKNLIEASCACALSEQEKESIRSYGYGGRIEIIRNGVGDVKACSPEEMAGFKSRHAVPTHSRILLFLSRIARKKNLPMLLEAFAANLQKRPDWILIVAGADEGGHLREVQSLIRSLRIEASVRLVGALFGKDKACAFTAASIFVLPSHSEGLPVAVLEAMAHGKPVIVTDKWSLPVKTSARFEWRVPAEKEAFEKALLEGMSSPAETLLEMGACAKSIVDQHFSWDTVAQQARALYTDLVADNT
jgi:poly(glycerol-phosphate) alpha-glucosyltransferase